jgi:pimeloyl-ACP methyl ester carboxylesterase
MTWDFTVVESGDNISDNREKRGETATMPYATNGAIRIYYQLEGEGVPLILHHGSFASGSDWRDSAYSDALKRDHQLIMIDARGHGSSDKPHDPAAYDMASRVSDVVSVLDALEIRRAHFFGYSMGGWIGFGMAKYGACP